MRSRFVVHEHHARNLHFDLRLEMDHVLKSWAVPKGPTLDPAKKRLAVAVPDHPISYIDYEGHISEGSYGAGDVRIWDQGYYESQTHPYRQLMKGKLNFKFFGSKLQGAFALIKLDDHPLNWLLIKVDDEYARNDWQLQTVIPTTTRLAA